MSDSLLACYRVEEDILRVITPTIPLTTNLMVGFKPVDGFAWASHMDVVSFDMYPPISAQAWQTAFPHDLMRSLKGGKPHMIMEQSPSQVNWQPQNPYKRPGRMRLHSLQAVAHGADGVMFFQGRQSQAGADRVLHFTAGVKSYTFTLPSTAVLSDFGGNAQAIGNNASVKVKVQFPANTVVSVGFANTGS
ncbi:MAG: hypothetical protein NVS4B11_06270 [Ktedonobacteraceae bacterium]